MSGFAVLYDPSRRPIAQQELEPIVDALRWRGPDGARSWYGRGIAIGFTLLDHGRISEILPLSLDGRCWIAGDIRLDDRRELASQLGLAAETSDPGIDLAAWERWREGLVEHLSPSCMYSPGAMDPRWISTISAAPMRSRH